MFKPCIIIPIYNHGKQLAQSIEQLISYQIPVIMVDDGSDKNTKEILREFFTRHCEESAKRATRQSRSSNKILDRHTLAMARVRDDDLEKIFLYHLPHNQGKGAAVIYGFREAYQKGFTHALQIDADGQHDLKDIPVFLKLAKNNPTSLINGYPIYDKLAPKSRVWGRKITNFWIRVETLSDDIKDAMCGFRVYPLKETAALLDKVSIGKKMEFDIEIIVHAYLNGINIINQSTHITYPQNGLSNFRLFRDNLRIAQSHARLFFKMLKRTLWRK